MSSKTRINPSRVNPKRRRSTRIVPKLSAMNAVRLRKQYMDAFGEKPVLRNVKSNTNLSKKHPRSNNGRRKSNTNLVMKRSNRSSESTRPNFVVRKSNFIKQANKSKRPLSLEPLPNINSARNQLMANIKSHRLFPKTASKMPFQKSRKVLRNDMITLLKLARRRAMGNAPVTHPQDRLEPKTLKEYENTMNYYYEVIKQKNK